MQMAQSSPNYVDITLDSEVTSLSNLLTKIKTEAGCNSFYCKNMAESVPESGYFFYNGVIVYDTVGGTSVTCPNVYRRNSSGANGNTSWAAAGTIPAGTVLRVWSLDHLIS